MRTVRGWSEDWIQVISDHNFPMQFHNFASSGDSVEKLLSHSLEVLGVQQIDMDGVKMLSGWLSFIQYLNMVVNSTFQDSLPSL